MNKKEKKILKKYPEIEEKVEDYLDYIYELEKKLNRAIEHIEFLDLKLNIKDIGKEVRAYKKAVSLLKGRY